MLVYAISFAAALALSFLLAYPVRALAIRLDVVDHPEKRKIHQIPIPLMGGLAIFLSFAAVSAPALALQPDVPQEAIASYGGLMAGAVIILLLGIYDDVRGLKAPVKFAVQTLAALVVVAAGGRIDLFTNPLGSSFELGWLGVPVALLWIVGVTNAVNLIDGLDGLAAGICAIASLGLFAVASGGHVMVATVAIALSGATIGFLWHNFYPARLFLGDTGSMFLGFTLAVIGLNGSFKATTATVLTLPIVVLGVPILDTLFAIFRRARRRVSPFKADREHIHHRLVRIGLHHRHVVLVIYFICAYLAVTAYGIAQFTPQIAFLFLAMLTIGGLIGLRTLQFLEERIPDGLTAPVVAEGGTATPRNRPDSLPGLTGRRRQPFETMICEVGGFREDFGLRAEMDSLCSDIDSMLSRRVRVHGVRAEPSSPGHLLLMLRTEPLRSTMGVLVRDGLAWYLEDHRERFSNGQPFPVINWLRPGPQERTPADKPARGAEREGAVAPAPPAGRAGLVGS